MTDGISIVKKKTTYKQNSLSKSASKVRLMQKLGFFRQHKKCAETQKSAPWSTDFELFNLHFSIFNFNVITLIKILHISHYIMTSELALDLTRSAIMKRKKV